MGIVRDDTTNKTMLFLDENTTIGNLIHVDENGTILSLNAGTWERGTILDKDTLVLYPNTPNHSFNYGTAFAVSSTTNNLQRGQYFNDGNITSSIYLSKDAMEEFSKHYSPNPHIVKTLNNGWTYLSLPSTMTICDSSIQSGLLDICNQDNNLTSLFGDNSDIDYVLRYTGSWSYWDNTGTTNPYYQMDRFTAVSSTEGVLVKTNTASSIDLPYDMFNNNTSKFISLYQDGWFLSSVTEDKTVQEVKTLVESQNKTLKYILLFRDNRWMVYAPYSDASVDQTIPRITLIFKDESFWVFGEQ